MYPNKTIQFRDSPAQKIIQKAIIKYCLITIGVTGLVALFAIMPGIAIPFNFFIKELNKDRGQKRKIYPSDMRKIFEKMKRRRLIKIVKTKSEIKIILQKDGVKKIITNNLQQLKFEKQKNWDKIWRVIIFDIPEKYKKQRDSFARKLKELNFYPLQKSVFVFPYPAYDLTDFLSEIYQISPYIRIIETMQIEGEEEILCHFNLKR
jgi:hypothetical protein